MTLPVIAAFERERGTGRTPPRAAPPSAAVRPGDALAPTAPLPANTRMPTVLGRGAGAYGRTREVAALVLWTLALFFALALASFAGDPAGGTADDRRPSQAPTGSARSARCGARGLVSLVGVVGVGSPARAAAARHPARARQGEPGNGGADRRRPPPRRRHGGARAGREPRPHGVRDLPGGRPGRRALRRARALALLDGGLVPRRLRVPRAHPHRPRGVLVHRVRAARRAAGVAPGGVDGRCDARRARGVATGPLARARAERGRAPRERAEHRYVDARRRHRRGAASRSRRERHRGARRGRPAGKAPRRGGPSRQRPARGASRRRRVRRAAPSPRSTTSPARTGRLRLLRPPRKPGRTHRSPQPSLRPKTRQALLLLPRTSAQPRAKRARKAPTIVDTSAALEKEKAESRELPKPSHSDFQLPSIDFLAAETVEPNLAIDRDKLLANAQMLDRDARATTASRARSRRSSRARRSRRSRSRPPPARRSPRSRARRRSRARALAQGAHRRADPRQEPHRLRAPERAARAGEPARARRGPPLPDARRRRCPCVLGRDIVGTPSTPISRSMPHVIVAGATGAGKSVGLNVMLAVAALSGARPTSCACSMIDPKVVELAPFDRIPHMLLPVVTDMKQAANALKWAVDEMERRYQLFANAGTKNITTYNGWVGARRTRARSRTRSRKVVIGEGPQRLPGRDPRPRTRSRRGRRSRCPRSSRSSSSSSTSSPT